MRHRFCDCADPVVFGHHHDPPPRTYRAGETFTMRGRNAGPVIYDEIAEYTRRLHQATQAMQNLTVTQWNWLEAPQTGTDQPEPAQPPETLTTYVQSLQDATGTFHGWLDPGLWDETCG